MRICSFSDCNRRLKARGLCSGHLAQEKRGAPLSPLRPMASKGSKPPCTKTDCGYTSWARGLCKRHYDAWRTEMGQPRGDSLANSLRFHYGLTRQQYEQKLEEQGGVCAICKQECISGKRLSIDHDHQTGEIRGLLCGRCNTALGLLGDDVERLGEAIHYLNARKWKKGSRRR